MSHKDDRQISVLDVVLVVVAFFGITWALLIPIIDGPAPPVVITSVPR